jgi:regulator of cell morphogenesis and NO signaling
MSELMNKSLGQIVNGNHRAAAVFEKYQLDFCCKGKRTLEQACAESNLEAKEVIAELEQVPSGNSCTVPVNYDKFSLTQLSDYIVNTHHSYVKREMPAIFNYLERVSAKHGDRHPEMRKVFALFADVKEEMGHHMQKEELVLFPRIKETERLVAGGNETTVNSSYLLSPINMMEEEHEHAGTAMAEIRQLTNNYTPPADACTTYKLSFAALEAFEKDLHQHVHLENNMLFPKALILFSQICHCSLN